MKGIMGLNYFLIAIISLLLISHFYQLHESRKLTPEQKELIDFLKKWKECV